MKNVWAGILALGICLGLGTLEAQVDSLRLIRTLELNEPADKIWVDAEGNILLLAPESGTITKYLKAFGHDSLIRIGGRSMRDEGLIHPVKLALPTRQRAYVLDDVSRRILLLTPNLKVAEARDFQGSLDRDGLWQDVYPISFAVNAAEDIYVLDGQNNRVIVFNALGEESLRFGGLDYGAGALQAPTDVIMSRAGKLLMVAEPSLNQLQVFDLFGVYRYSIQIPDSLEWGRARLFENQISLQGETGFWLCPLQNPNQRISIPYPIEAPIQDLFIQGELLYLLLDQKILVFQVRNEAPTTEILKK